MLIKKFFGKIKVDANGIELKKEFSDWIKKKKAYLQNEFDNL